MARRPTISDVARSAGVSVATVDRVLNARAPVREETQRKVFAAAQQIGFHAVGLIEQRVEWEKPELVLGLVLNKERQAFYKSLRAAAITAAAAEDGIRIRPHIVFSASQAPADMAAHFEAMIGTADVVASTAINHVAVTDAVSRLKDEGIPCFALMNDFAQGVRQSYIGLNNLK